MFMLNKISEYKSESTQTIFGQQTNNLVLNLVTLQTCVCIH